MKKTMSIAYLILILTATLVAIAQPISTVDAIQNLKLSQVEDLAVANGRRIDVLASNLSDLRSSVETSRSWVIGFGCCLTTLHVLQMLNGRRKSNGSAEPRLKDRY